MCTKLANVDLLDWKVDDSWILLENERVLCESLVVHKNENKLNIIKLESLCINNAAQIAQR